jgi:hypothetical protein
MLLSPSGELGERDQRLRWESSGHEIIALSLAAAVNIRTQYIPFSMIEHMATYNFLHRFALHVPDSRLTCREANRPWSSLV